MAAGFALAIKSLVKEALAEALTDGTPVPGMPGPSRAVEKDDQEKKCHCNLTVKQMTCGKEGRNLGKTFLRCPKPAQQCSYFEWETSIDEKQLMMEPKAKEQEEDNEQQEKGICKFCGCPFLRKWGNMHGRGAKCSSCKKEQSYPGSSKAAEVKATSQEVHRLQARVTNLVENILESSSEPTVDGMYIKPVARTALKAVDQLNKEIDKLVKLR